MEWVGSMSLTEFLLARIADDEAVARRVRAVGSCEPAYDPARVLAEVEAKRQIVAGLPPSPECDPGCDHPPFEAHWVIKELAAVYADHPDYRSEWRP